MAELGAARGAFVVSDVRLNPTGFEYFGCLATLNSAGTLEYKVGRVADKYISDDETHAVLDGQRVELLSGTEAQSVQDLMAELRTSHFDPRTRAPRNTDLEREATIVPATLSAPQRQGTRTTVTLTYNDGRTESRPAMEIFNSGTSYTHYIPSADRTTCVYVPMVKLAQIKTDRDRQMTKAAKTAFEGGVPCVLDRITDAQKTRLYTAIALNPKQTPAAVATTAPEATENPIHAHMMSIIEKVAVMAFCLMAYKVGEWSA